MSSLEKMMFFFLLLFMFPSSHMKFVYCHADGDSCEPVRCSRLGPEIRFPFRLKGRQPQRCGYHGFDLFCNNEQTMVHFLPLGMDVVAREINYESQTLIIAADERNCLWSLLFGTSYSYVPVTPVYFNYNYTLFNCSRNAVFEDGYSIATACLSDAQHNAFVFYSDRDVGSLPASCRPIKTISTPVLYPPDLNFTRAIELESENHFEELLMNRERSYSLIQEGVLHLVWHVPGCIGCEWNDRMLCGYKNSNSTDTVCLPRPPQPPRHQRGLQREHIIMVSIIGSLLLLATLMAAIKVYCSWKSNRKLDLENEIKVEKFLEDYKYLKPTRYSYADLKRMTGQFKEILGQGSYGCVFKGVLSNGTPIAVKILTSFGGDGKEFMNEVGTMGKIHHVNVVRLLGFCADRLKRALIYEFMPNESLEKFIFTGSTNNHFLGWEKLQEIAIGIARGIEYLHQGCDQRILHFDIKPHNILLDENFNPKVSDFGLAKMCSKGQSAVSMTAARGTMGYIAPEVFSRNFGNVSYKSDVYSFGMLLLEMVGGRKNIDITMENTSQAYFPEWIYNCICQERDLGLTFEIEEDANIAKKLAIVALWCIQWHPVDRPSMNSVVQMLEGSIESLTTPPNPFTSSAPANNDAKNICLMNLSTISE